MVVLESTFNDSDMNCFLGARLTKKEIVIDFVCIVNVVLNSCVLMIWNHHWVTSCL